VKSTEANRSQLEAWAESVDDLAGFGAVDDTILAESAFALGVFVAEKVSAIG
jgi:hypothetical protein